MKPEDRERLIAYRKAERVEREAEELAWFDENAEQENRKEAQKKKISGWLVLPYLFFVVLLLPYYLFIKMVVWIFRVLSKNR